MLQPRVIDLSHHNDVVDLRATAGAGVWGIIHKATQGTSYRDPTYAARRPLAGTAGMLWGAYHFGDASDPAQQVDNFLSAAQPDASTLLCLDYEDHPSGRSHTMRPEHLIAWLRELERRTGRRAVLYSGNLIKEDIPRLSPSDRAYVAGHLLWLCQYGSSPTFPQAFGRTFLWQFTDGAAGPLPHRVPGVTGLVDLNAFNGSRADLEAAWIAAPDSDLSARARADDDTDSAPSPRGGDDSGGLPPFLRRAPTGGLNVQPQRAAYDMTTEVVQRELDAMGYHDVGAVDGRWGGKTAGAIKAFFNDRGVTAVAEMGPTLTTEISRAKREGFTRPISTERANARPSDLAPKIDAVRVSLWSRFWAKIAAGFAAVGLTGSSISDTFQTVRDKLYPVQDFFNHVPGTVWFLMMLAVAGAVWYATSRAAKAVTKDYNTGRLN